MYVRQSAYNTAAYPEKATRLSHDEGDFDGLTEVGNPSFKGNASHAEKMDADKLRRNINAKIANPLAGYSHAQCRYLTDCFFYCRAVLMTSSLQWPSKAKRLSEIIRLATMRTFGPSVSVPFWHKIPTDMETSKDSLMRRNRY